MGNLSTSLSQPLSPLTIHKWVVGTSLNQKYLVEKTSASWRVIFSSKDMYK